MHRGNACRVMHTRVMHTGMVHTKVMCMVVLYTEVMRIEAAMLYPLLSGHIETPGMIQIASHYILSFI